MISSNNTSVITARYFRHGEHGIHSYCIWPGLLLGVNKKYYGNHFLLLIMMIIMSDVT